MVLKLSISLRKSYILTIFCFPIYEHDMPFHLLKFIVFLSVILYCFVCVFWISLVKLIHKYSVLLVLRAPLWLCPVELTDYFLPLAASSVLLVILGEPLLLTSCCFSPWSQWEFYPGLHICPGFELTISPEDCLLSIWIVPPDHLSFLGLPPASWSSYWKIEYRV